MSHAARKRRQRRSKGGAARVVIVLFCVFAVGLTVAGAGGAGYVMSVADSVNLDDMAQVDPGAPSVVYAKDGTRLGYLPGPVWRTPVTTKKMAEYVRQATVAVEDRRFYEHHGVDVEGIFRAASRNLTSGSNVEGASTLEMQLIRNLWTKDDTNSLKRKIREARLASQLEDRHPGQKGKAWVLTTYLNTAPYGTVDGKAVKGVEAAACVFFSTTAKKLTLAQAATIAGLPQAPTDYNPFLNPQGALVRRNDVLRRMGQQGMVPTAEVVAAQNESLGVKKGDCYSKARERFFLNYVRKELRKTYSLKRVQQGGLKVYTTLDLKKQQLARKAISAHLDPAAGDPSSAVVTLDPNTGDIQAAASSVVFGDDQYDLAIQGSRQPGSTFKTIVLTAALEQGISPSTTYPAPGSFTIPPEWCSSGPCQVKNFAGEGSKGGSMDLRTATLKSVNTVFFQLDLDVGPENVTKTARAMGITSELISVPSEGLGAASVSPLEMARVYATVANGGMRVVPRAITRVEFPDGRVRKPQKVRKTRAIPKDVASEVNRILQEDIKGGTASSANFGCPAGAKTGTTDGPSDVWLAGFTPRMSTAVWVGYPKTRRTIVSTSQAGGNIQGASVAAPIWHDYMQAAHGSYCGDFQGLVPFSGTIGTGKYAGSAPVDDDETTDGDETTTGDESDGEASADGRTSKKDKSRGGQGGNGPRTGGVDAAKPYAPD